MNHFELFGIPVSFQPDLSTLATRLAALMQTEPTQSAHINKAYHLLQDEDATIRYILHLKGLFSLEDDDELEPQFRMEVRDINEELMEVELDETQEQLLNVEQKSNRLLLKIYEDVAPVIENYKEGVTTEEELLQVKEYYFEKKYLQRILDRIQGIRNIASPL